MAEIPDLNRRTYVGSFAALTAIAAGAPTAMSGLGDDEDGEEDEGEDEETEDEGEEEEEEDDDSDQPTASDEIPASHPFIGDLDGDDLSGDMEFDVENRYDGDPAVGYEQADEDDREWVIHYATDSEETGDYQETQDYPAAMINLRERLDRNVSLGSLGGEGVGLAFDYFVGKMHDQYIPGQVYLVVQDPGRKKDDKAWGLYKNVRRGGPKKEWATLDVVEEMRGNGAPESGPWRAIQINIDPDGFRGSFDTFSDAIIEQAIQTRDEEGETFDDVFERYGNGARVLAMGLGSGSSRVKTSRDIYYDNYRFETGNVDETFEIPAALRMVGDFDSNGQITATLEFEMDQEEVDLDDLDEDTVRLYPFSQIMPPLGDGAEATNVEINDEINATFAADNVSDLDGLGTGSQRVVVAGQFDYDHVVWFYAIGEVDVPGN